MKKLYTILILTIAILGLAGFVFWRYFYLGTLVLDVTPSDALVTVDDKPTPDRTIELTKGTHRIEVSAPRHRTEEFSVESGYGSQASKKVTLISLPKPAKIIDGPLRSVASTPQKDRLFFAKDGVLYQYDLTAPAGTPGLPITPRLENVAEVVWAPNFQLALLKKTDGEIGLYDFNRYDLLHQEYRPYGKEMQRVVWSPDGDGFYAEYKAATGEHSLIKANPTNTSQTRLQGLASFPIANFVFTANTTTSLLFSGTDQKQPADIVRFDAHQKIFAPITDTGNAYGPVISPERTKIAYIDNGELVAADSEGKNKRNLGVRAKINNYAFANETTLIAFTANTVTVINVTDGTSKEFAVYAPSEAITDLIALPNSKSLYYLFQNDLYRLDFAN